MPNDLAPRLRTLLVALPLSLSLAACGGAGENATPGDVDAKSSATVTEEELASFKAPADSVLSAEQVDRYLKTTLLQFDLVRKEAEGMRAKAAQMEARAQEGGFIAGLRNAADAGSLAMGWVDLVGGSYVRSARTLGYNPAEMEWVRERMTEVSGYMVMKPMLEQAEQAAGQLESAAAAAGGAAVRAEAAETTAPAVLANAEVLRKARPAVSDTTWQMVGLTGSTGLAALAGLADPSDQEAARGLDELRRLYTSVLANKPFQPTQQGAAEVAPAN